MVNLYNRIELLCKENKLNVTQMCKEVGISRSVMSELKSGRTQNLSSDTSSKISQYFNVPVSFLIAAPPFNAWEKINNDRDRFFYDLPISIEELSETWKIDKRDTKSAKIEDLIYFLSCCVKSAQISYEGDWSIEFVDGFIEKWHKNAIEALQINNIIPLPKTKEVPLLGDIACGEPILAEENIEMYVKVNENVPADFALRCKGDSMINSRIYDGDIVYIRQQSDVDDGEIAAVLIGDEATLKKVYKYPNKLVLRASNPMYDDFIYTDEQLEDIRILGKAVAFFSVVR